MKSQYLTILFIISAHYVYACSWNYQQPFWPLVESKMYINNVEISESVNDYIFCELQENCNNFLQKLSVQSQETQDLVIEELKRPISDTYQLLKIANSVAVSEADDRLKANLLKALCLNGPILQNQHTIPNFYLDENDTTRYTHHYLYEEAYQLIEDMLEGKRAISIKDAEFAIENAFVEGQANRAAYDYTISAIVNNVMRDAALLRPRMPSDATAKNLALTLFFSEDRESNNYQHFTYDVQSLFNDGGIVSGMVLSLLQTGKGTCRSLPYLYKIIAHEIGAPSYLACAPMHFYIKQQDNMGKWWSYETTRFTYCDERYIIEVNHVPPMAIASGLYTKPLTDKETLCQLLYDLCYFYEKRTGFYSNAFVRRCYTLGLRYFPISILKTLELSDLKYQLDKELWERGKRDAYDFTDYPDLQERYLRLQNMRAEFTKLGYYQYSRQEIKDKMEQIKEYIEKNKNNLE